MLYKKEKFWLIKLSLIYNKKKINWSIEKREGSK
jgi:hypothetical protein